MSNATQLQDALTDASDNGIYSGQSNSVYVSPGTYLTIGNQPFHYTSTATTGDLGIFGGFSTCALISHDPSQTILDGGSATKVLSLLSASTQIAVQGLTIQNGNATDGGGGLAINTEGGYNATILIEHCIIRNNHSNSLGGGFYLGADGSGHTFFLQYNLIYGNSAGNLNGGGGYLSSSGANATLLHNTITQNTTTGTGAGGVVDAIVGSSAITGNIFSVNGSTSIFFSGDNVNFSDNDYAAIGGATPSMMSGNMSVSPQFVSVAGADFRLSRTSPLLAAIPANTSGNSDLIGNAYPKTGKVDMGAYEETIFVDDLEGN